jgi:maltooligosyltrehalose trehalohydrolase
MPSESLDHRNEAGVWVSGAVTTFRVWAPRARTVAVVTEAPGSPERFDMRADDGGWFVVTAPIGPGARYRYLLDDNRSYPDPASRYQPEGPHGPSEVVDASRFRWTDEAWTGPSLSDLAVYELHVGTFTAEGTWAAALQRLPELSALGISVIELMPVADFPGRFGWGYDGVNLFAPTRLYGRPDDFRAFVNHAHELGLAVILDVVYNHVGPDGCWLDAFAPHYFSSRSTEWGRGFNFDGPDAAPVRAFFEENAAYWIADFHLDGLRLDATQQVFDTSPVHIVRAVTEAARAAAPSRRIWVIAENEPQDSRLVRPAIEGGFGLDGLWNDDFHHSARVAATGMREAYYTDYRGTAAEFVAAATRGFLYQGQWYAWQRQPRGTSAAGLLPRTFIAFLENHDQVANSVDGARLHTLTPPALWRTLTAVLLLGPWTPMLFQGQERNSTAPFLYFADHSGTLANEVAVGRRSFLSQFPSIHTALQDGLVMAQPDDPRTFARSAVDSGALSASQQQALSLHTTLLALRRNDRVVRQAGCLGVDAAVLAPSAWVMRYRSPGSGVGRLLVVNLGDALALDIAPEPLLAPPSHVGWHVLWHSDDPRVGGTGREVLEHREAWRLPERSAWLLAG